MFDGHASFQAQHGLPHPTWSPAIRREIAGRKSALHKVYALCIASSKPDLPNNRIFLGNTELRGH